MKKTFFAIFAIVTVIVLIPLIFVKAGSAGTINSTNRITPTPFGTEPVVGDLDQEIDLSISAEYLTGKVRTIYYTDSNGESCKVEIHYNKSKEDVELPEGFSDWVYYGTVYVDSEE